MTGSEIRRLLLLFTGAGIAWFVLSIFGWMPLFLLIVIVGIGEGYRKVIKTS